MYVYMCSTCTHRHTHVNICAHTYIYIYWKLRGLSQPGNRISVSVRVVRASGRGEAKLCGRARGDSML